MIRDFGRLSPLAIVFTDPQIAMVGSHYSELSQRDFVSGEVSFAGQGRSRVMLKNQGVLRTALRDAHKQLRPRVLRAA